MIDPAFPALSNAVAGSLLWRGAVGAIDALATAWRTSVTARLLAPLRSRTSVGQIAWIAVIGGLAAIAAQQFVPVYIRPGVPMLWPAAAIVVAIAIAVGAAALQQAWPQSLLARLMRPRRSSR